MSRHKGVYALQQIHGLINTSPILHVSFNTPSSPFPVILPMIGQMGSFERPSADNSDPLDLYIHGYVSSRIMNTVRSSEGLPLCVAASHVDGIVLAMSAFSSSYNYRSAVLFGRATLVEDKAEKEYAMELITDSVVPGRWKGSRQPPMGSELQSTSILRVKIESGSAKIREGQAGDEKYDMENQGLLDSTWSGVIPVYQTFGEPISSTYSKVEFPGYAADYVGESNKNNKEHSITIVAEKTD